MSRTIRDPKGRTLTLEQSIGRGSFGEVFAAVPERSDGALVAKLPLPADALVELGEALRPTVADLCQRMVRDQAKLLERLPANMRPEIIGTVDGGGAVPCLLMERLEGSLAERLSHDLHFMDLMDVLAAACRGLQPLHDAGVVHGNLKPGNIFLAEDGSARFTDPAHERARTLRDAIEMLPGWHPLLPPEVLNNLEGLAPLDTPAVDTFAMGKMFYQAILSPRSVAHARELDGLFLGAVDRAHLTPFMEALEARYERDRGNPNTRELFMRRTQSLLTRMLSDETAPSPPFRFYRALDLAARFEELKTLFHPSFEQMGPIVFDRPTGHDAFVAGEDVRFSLAFNCQGGLKNPDLLNIFIYVRDLQREEKVTGLDQEVLPVHDGTRFRCEFALRGLGPGDYLLRIGMGLKGTPGKPTPRDALVVVEPAPVVEPEPQPMQAAPMQAAPMQAAPMQAAPMQAAPMQAAPMQATEALELADTQRAEPLSERQERQSGGPRLTTPTVTVDEDTGQVVLESLSKRPAVEPRKVSKKKLQTARPPAEAPPPADSSPSDEAAAEDYYLQGRGGVSSSQDDLPTKGGLAGGLSDRTFLIAAGVVFIITVLVVLWAI